MKPTMTLLVGVMAAGLAAAQNPKVIQNTRGTMNGVSNHAAAASSQALDIQPAAASTAHGRGTSGAVKVPVTQTAPKIGVHPAAIGGHARHEASTKPGPKKRNAGRGEILAAPAQPVAVAVPQDAPAKSEPARTEAAVSGAADVEGGPVPDARYNANGKRDPFLSPVVSHAAGGSGCSTGKKCLEIGNINLKGVVHAESGFIAVVSNGLNKAYFLRENDPVFNGYVMKITGDSIVFQETLQDRLGKSFTREVVKKITTPAV
jgi:hypothetical protein